MSDQADIIGVGLGAIIGAADKGDFCFGMKVAAEKLVMADAAELLSIIKAMLANGALTGHQGPDLFTGTANRGSKTVMIRVVNFRLAEDGQN